MLDMSVILSAIFLKKLLQYLLVSQIDLHQARERIEEHDSAENIFRAVLESAGNLFDGEDNYEALVEELGNNVEFIKVSVLSANDITVKRRPNQLDYSFFLLLFLMYSARKCVFWFNCTW